MKPLESFLGKQYNTRAAATLSRTAKIHLRRLNPFGQSDTGNDSSATMSRTPHAKDRTAPWALIKMVVELAACLPGASIQARINGSWLVSIESAPSIDTYLQSSGHNSGVHIAPTCVFRPRSGLHESRAWLGGIMQPPSVMKWRLLT